MLHLNKPKIYASVFFTKIISKKPNGITELGKVFQSMVSSMVTLGTNNEKK